MGTMARQVIAAMAGLGATLGHAIQVVNSTPMEKPLAERLVPKRCWSWSRPIPNGQSGQRVKKTNRLHLSRAAKLKRRRAR